MNGDNIEPKRRLFHTDGGGVDLARLVEQIIPAIVIGAIVVFANAKVTEYQIGDMRKELDRANDKTYSIQQRQSEQSEKLAGISAQMTAFLAQQVTINTAMDARLTFMERQTFLERERAK